MPTQRARVESTLSGLLDEPAAVRLTSSCTHALEAAATVLRIGPGDEVVVPAFSFPSTANPFVMRGARVRFADCDPATGNMTPDEVSRCSSPRTRAVVCMHYGGVACDMEAIVPMCADSDWHLIEDAAHGLFARSRGVPLGRFGTLGALSFHRTKNISCHEGGALVVNDAELLERVQSALEKGTNRTEFERGAVDHYEWSGPGSAWTLADPLVAVLDSQLERREEIQTARHRVWQGYAEGLAQWATDSGVWLPHVPEHVHHPAHLFWMLLPEHWQRDQLVSHCSERSVLASRHYGSLPQSAFGATIADPADRCPNARVLERRLVRLPVRPEMTASDIQHVVDVVSEFGSRTS